MCCPLDVAPVGRGLSAMSASRPPDVEMATVANHSNVSVKKDGQVSTAIREIQFL